MKSGVSTDNSEVMGTASDSMEAACMATHYIGETMTGVMARTAIVSRNYRKRNPPKWLNGDDFDLCQDNSRHKSKDLTIINCGRPERNYPRGNYIVDDKSVGSYISPSEARELKPAGPCKKVPGLMYSSEYPDFNPFTWKNKCTHKMKSVRFILPSESFGEKDEFIDVHRYSDLTVTSQLHELSASIASRHKVVRDKKSWNSKGSMFAAGFHMDRSKKVKVVCHYPITGSNKDPSLISDEDSQL